MANKREYRRLTRSRVRPKGFLTAISTRSSLWLGKDHLLNIDSNRFTEKYKRFYFRDIQAITIRETNRRKIGNFAVVLSLLLWLGVTINRLLDPAVDPVTSGLLAIAFLILAAILLVNNLLGATCIVYLRTAVQIEELPSLRRVRRVRKLLNEVRPLISAAQGQITPEEISNRMQEMIQSFRAVPRVVFPTSPLNLSR